ncbi:MAG: rhomboid family intramembrane serine protease [Candidatus Algichlamydia australiensis]|nr:rhomboid family intramembrane serine protease [Chlamydiales bacterium]
MRLVGEFSNELDAQVFSGFLTRRGIKSKPEGAAVWVEDEEMHADALDHYQHFVMHPQDARYEVVRSGLLAVPKEKIKPQVAPPVKKQTPITTFIILLCTALFFWQLMQRMEMSPVSMQVKDTVALTPIEGALLYDYPEAFAYATELFEITAIKQPEELQNLPPKEAELWNKATTTPYWQGIYDIILKWPEANDQFNLPMFVKIRAGEIYRTITPIVMHGGFLHILFNMLWLFLLGRMVEERIGVARYLALSLIVAIVSNTVQYLMSGPAFLGYSGVITGLAGFIWYRQRKAPWEGYPLQKATAIFLGVFIFGMMGFQIVLFILQRFFQIEWNLRIANSAHVVGALVGIFLARFPLFTKQRAKK